ncbi:hypothetical protein [Streptomyces sp. NRRL F-5135]|uniref:hypothetical protein n=1 Tax=Streptomyces sp. NRRL F-5135 TaxID=1463858 RepID=UPI000A64B255|nr:hypothetical protein [Streptomyces sp. NRRL F-5135]
MARTLTGRGRVTAFPFLYGWPDRYALLGYTATGWYGTTAVVGQIPVPGVVDLSLMDVAARHEPARLYGGGSSDGDSGGDSGEEDGDGAESNPFAEACWLICVGWGARSVPKPGTLDLPDVSWALEIDRTTELGRIRYGHDRLHTGRLTFDDPRVTARVLDRAASVLPDAHSDGPPA